MKENYVYPIKIKKESDIYIVTFPNFPGQITEADSEEKAIIAAQELLALCISDNEEIGIGCRQAFTIFVEDGSG